jgi:gliding motility-associatede transport system auxiliary component
MVKNVLNIVGWLGTALVVGAVAVRMLRPEWDQYAIYAAWGGLACVVLYTLGQWREIIDYFQRRNARYGAIASVSVLIFLAILVAVNYLSFRQNKRWDLTKNQQFTLSDQTVKLLKGLDAPVKFLVFDKPTGFDPFRNSLEEYRYQSPSKVDVQYIDADKKPGDAKQYQVTTYGTVVIDYKGRVERVNSSQEQDLTNGLVKVLTGEKKKIYFVQGHGERDPDNMDRLGYSGVKTALEGDNYEVAKTVLAQEKDVPTDAAVVVIAGPKTDLLQPEADMLQRFLKKGGHVLVLTDPPAEKDPPTPVTDALLKDWDFQAGNDVVVDASGIGQLIGTDASVPVVATYPSHPITERFNNVLTAYPLARSITPILPATNGRAAVTILQTSPRSWAETDMNQIKSGKVELNPDKGDKPGPVSIGAVTATNAVDVPKPDPAKTPAGDQPRTPESRFVTIGDSDFAANNALRIQGNQDLFLNTISWLAQQENLISIRAKPADDSRLTMTARQTAATLWMSLLVIPAIVFGTGVYTWWRKR